MLRRSQAERARLLAGFGAILFLIPLRIAERLIYRRKFEKNLEQAGG